MSSDREEVLPAATPLWREITERMMARLEHISNEHHELGLTPGHVRALILIDPEDPKPMRWFADQFVVDASTVTFIMDRLEEKGLIERMPLAGDRRMKTVRLTPLGELTKATIETKFFRPPEGFSELPQEILEALAHSLED